MIVVKEVSAKSILDSRKEKTISVLIKTNIGNFCASAPNGESKGKHEAKTYKKDLEGDIATLKKFSDYFSEEVLEKFEDLERLEDILDRQVGGNTIIALESAVLKALAKYQKKQVWELIDPCAKKFPRLAGNCIEGGMHSSSEKKPNFQEFLLIPNLKSVKESFEMNRKLKKEIEILLDEYDEKFKQGKTDENAWETSLNEKQVLEIIQKVKIPIGTDVASSSFHKRKKYFYENPILKRDEEEQMEYLSNLIKNFGVYYIEDPFFEEDFENFSKLLERFPDRLIVGDDLTVTNSNRLKKAIAKKSVNAVIVKPNQCGSLLEVKKVCELAKSNNIKIIFSHRSGETEENILADLAFGFGADFFKCGIDGKERETKLKRLIEIEKTFKSTFL